MNKYPHIIGEQDLEKATSEKIVGDIVNYYEAIIGCMPGNVYLLDKNCIGIGCNKNVLSMFGLKSLADFKGLSFEQMGKIGNWDSVATQSFKDDTLEVIRSGKPKLNIEEPPIPHHEGRMIHFLTSRVPLFDQAHTVIGVVGISIDISELKNAQAALKEAKEQAEAASLAKSEFVANMSHDVKTPLAGIIGISELLAYRLENENRELAETLLISGRQLLNFIENCLELSKIESSNIITEAEYFHLTDVINEIYELFQPAIKAKDLSITIYLDDNIPKYLLGSRAGIYRILLNLIGNAVKFTLEGSITVNLSLVKKTENREAIIKFIVEDTGIGIASENQAIIFDRFTRLVPSYKGTHEGSGIGLYIVQTYVKKMSGEIFLESVSNKGSQFTVILPFQIPLLSEEEYKEITKTSLRPYQRSSMNLLNTVNSNIGQTILKMESSPKILLVEDNIIAQRIESSLLRSLGCLVDIAESGEKALDMFIPGKYDLILMDIGLPNMQGDVVASQIRKREGGSCHPVPIIALTAHISERMKNAYLTTGMNDIYSKPLLHNQAKQLINYYCQQKNTTDQEMNYGV